MRAQLLPLKGKYYGTEVEIFDDNERSVGYFAIWLTPNREEDYKPSKREIETYMTPEWGSPTFEEAEAEYEISDKHYECELAFKVATKLVEAINV